MAWYNTHNVGALTALKIPVEDGSTAGGSYKLASELQAGTVLYTATLPLAINGTVISLGPVPLSLLAQSSATTGQVPIWNGSAWAPGTVSGGSGASPATTTPLPDAGAGSVGTSTLYARADHVHPAPPASTISGVTIDGSTIPATAGSPYQMATADRAVDVNKTTGAATAIKLPTNPTLWVEYAIIDGKGDAATNNITISGASGVTISGAATLVINSNNDAYTLRAVNATTWRIS